MQNKILKLVHQNKFKFLYSQSISIFLFILFFCFNLYYFTKLFFNTFLNIRNNGDEYYQYHLYSISDVTLEKIFYARSQIYIFLSSIVNYFLNNPRMSTRVISLIACSILTLYFVKRITSGNNSLLEKAYRSTLFISAIFITNQMFLGTSDFLAIVFIIPAFLIIVENTKSGEINLKLKQNILIGVLFAIAVATRPTMLVLIFTFYISLLLMGGVKLLLVKKNLTVFITSIIVLFMVNFLPLVEYQKLILDVKEIPEETGVNWFQMNYLMAKLWDSNQIPNAQWITSQEVINFKKSNPDFIFPKNQIDLLLKEPGLYLRQMIRMFVKALYSSYRFMYLLFPLLFLSFWRSKKINIHGSINSSNEILFQNRFVIIFHLLSIIVFSFLAVKLFEFRWVIPTMILYSFFALKYLSGFPIKARFLIYNLSFISGISMYILFFFKG